ncbi:MAG: alpha/beta hydrolase [Acidimicrobiales bacterium]
MNGGPVRLSALAIGAAVGWAAERLVMRRVDLAAAPSEPLPLPAAAVDRAMVMRDGASMHWIEAGEGRPLILLHGITLEAEAWTRQFALADRSRVMAIDLRGHGRSTAGTDGATIAANAGDLAELLEREDLHDAVIAGHSMGGMVLAHFLATAPASTVQRVSSAVFVDSAIRSPMSPSLRSERLDAFLQRPAVAAVVGTVPDSDAGRLAVMTTFGRRPSTLDLQTVAQSFDRLDPETYWQAMPSILDHDVRAAIAERSDLDRVEVAVIVGSLDRLTPMRCARELVDVFPGSTLHVLDGVGHQAMMEAPAAVNEVLAGLLDHPA